MPSVFSMFVTLSTIFSKPSSPKSSCSFFSKSSPREAYSFALTILRNAIHEIDPAIFVRDHDAAVAAGEGDGEQIFLLLQFAAAPVRFGEGRVSFSNRLDDALIRPG